MTRTTGQLSLGQRVMLAVPYLWFLLFFALPFVIVVKISLAEALIAVPPYTELVAWSKEQMASYKYPRIVQFVDSLPMTATGKILKRELS